MSSEPTPRQPPEIVVPRYARIDVIGGTIMVFIAALVWYGAIGLNVGQIINFGPGAMPKGLAILLFVSGGAVLLRGLLQGDETAEPLMLAIRPPTVLAMAIVFFALFLRGGDFWIFSTPQLGLMFVGPLTVFIAGYATLEANARELIVLAFGMTAAALLIFPDLLGVSIPALPKVVQDAIPPDFGVDNAGRVVYIVYFTLTAMLYLVFFGQPGARNG